MLSCRAPTWWRRPAGWAARLTEVVKGRLLGRSGRLGRWWPGHSAADLSPPASPSPPAGAPTASGPTVKGTATDALSDGTAADPPGDGLQELGGPPPDPD